MPGQRSERPDPLTSLLPGSSGLGRSLRQDDDAVAVGRQPLALAEDDSREDHRAAGLAGVQPALALAREGPQRPDPEGLLGQLVGVPDAAEDDDPGPAVLRGGHRQVAADQTAALRAAAVDDQHPTLPR
jgi:hypothetical protein